MDENGSTLSDSNRLKPIITYRKPAIDQCNYREDNNGEESFHEFSWPPKSYTCSFCKREFRSAQALGGHMNVHRREKAKLRQMTPQRYLSFLHPQSQFLDQNPNPNPNPNIASCFTSNTPSFPSMFPPFRYSCCLPFSDPCGFHVLCRSNGVKSEAFGPRKPDVVVGFSHEKEAVVVKKLDDDLLVEPKFDDLDLELRLGCS